MEDLEHVRDAGLRAETLNLAQTEAQAEGKGAKLTVLERFGALQREYKAIMEPPGAGVGDRSAGASLCQDARHVTGYPTRMPKARVVYKGKNTFAFNEPCPACGKKPSTKQVCRKCNETGCGYCMMTRCTSCGASPTHNLTFADIK